MPPKKLIRASPARALALRMLVASAVVPALVIGPTVTVSAEGDDPEPVDTSMQKLAIDGIDADAATETRTVGYNAPPTAQHGQVRAVLNESPHDEVKPNDDDLVALTKKENTQDFSALGVTWESEQEAVEVWVRTKTAPKTWSDWEYVPSAQDHGPDPGTSEGAGRAGTDPLMVPESDGVQVRVEAKDGTAPTGMKVNLIDPKQVGQDAQLDQKAVPPGSASAAATKPHIITRAQWGADESLRRQGPQYGTINGAFVHHTASTNNYTASEVAAQLRSIYTYHVRGRGWNDIGYNFLVDKYGRIFEGRYGGVDQAVVGAHTIGYNSQSFAMSALGDYQNGGQPSAAMMDSYAKLFAWKLGQYGVNPTTKVSLYGRQFDAISAHLNAMSTSCPGNTLYAQLPKIRRQALALQGSSTAAPPTPPTTGNGSTTPPPTTTPSSSKVKHTLRRGSPYRSEVRLLQRKLGISADGIYGSGTEAAVKRYQRSKGLGADGIAGPNTLRAMGLYGTGSTATPVKPKPKPVTPKPKPSSSAKVKHTLRRGSPYRSEVRLLQRKLGITADGIYGSGTEAAVKRYQRSKRLGADGIAGPNTLRAMGLYGSTSAATKPVTPRPKPSSKPKPTTKPSSSTKVKHTLRRGSPYRSEVRLLQRKLRISADGIYGSGTEAAVKRYQRSKRLGVDGIAGPNTLRAMGLR